MDTRLRTLAKNLSIVAGASAVLGLAAAPAAVAAPDPRLADQWALSTPGAIGAGSAWTESAGAGIVVAILDTGIQLDHPDLAANLWVNTGEVPGNGRDDDANGIVDDVNGANMFDKSANVSDDNGHGTHVAGIVAARRGNGEGGSGLAPEAKIMPVKVLNAGMSGNTSVLAAGIRYAVKQGARILNVSINGDEPSAELEAAVKFAGEQGATIVASSGNKGRNIDTAPSYPASFPDPAVLSATATGETGVLWTLSNIGQRAVDIAAPGEHILSTARGSGYQYRIGTSAAAPYVAGSLALLASVRPDLPQSSLREILLSTARRSPDLSASMTSGALDVGAAMDRLVPGRPKTIAAAAAAPGAGTTTLAGLRLRLRLGSKTRAGRRATLRWSATGAAEVARWRVLLDSRVIKTIDESDTLVVRKRIARAGKHRWTVQGFDGAGAKVVSAKRTFRVLRKKR